MKPRIRVRVDRHGAVQSAALVPPRAGAAASGYEASRYARRLKEWVPPQENINTLLAAGGELLRARAKQTVRDNPYGFSAAESWTANLIGTGVKPSSLVADASKKEQIDALWEESTDEMDADGVTDFYGQQALAAWSMFTAGEAFARFRPRRAEDGLRVPLQIQLIDPPQLPLWKTHIAENGNAIRCGIEFDRIGRRIAYHFLRDHPGDATQPMTSGEFVRVPASEVLHLYRPLEIGQIRGQPHVTPALVRLFLLDQYDDAELERKKVAALFVGAITSPAPGAKSTLAAKDQGDGTALLGMQPGALIPLFPGEDIKFGQPADVGGGYEPFQYRNLTAATAGMGVPYMNVTGDLRAANYASSRAGLVELRRRLQQILWMSVVFQLCRPVWRRWMTTAVVSGALALPGFARDSGPWLRVKWIAPKWEWVDPLKDRNAEKVAVDEGFKARSDVVEGEGEDVAEVDRRRAADQQRERDLKIARPAAIQPAAGGPPNGPQPAGNEEDEDPQRERRSPDRDEAA